MSTPGKHVLICTPSHSLQGGVERIIESLSAGLPDYGFRVTVALARGERFHDPVQFHREYPQLTTTEIDGRGGTPYDRRRALERTITSVDPDLVLNARLFDVYPAVSRLKQAGHRVRMAVTIQAYEAGYIADLASYAAFTDLCVTSGSLIAEGVRRFTTLPPEMVRSIPGGIAPARHLVVREDGAPLRLGYAGRLDPDQKRILDLIPFVHELRKRGIPFTLDISGDGPARAQLQVALPEARFRGWVSTRELYDEVYPALDVFLHFAAWEGVTIAPREAMVHGAVPVVSDFTGRSLEGQFVDSENSLVFPVGDVQAAARCIQLLNEDRGLLLRLARNAVLSQTGIRSEKGAVSAWAEAFDEALARPGRVARIRPPTKRESGALSRAHVPEAIAGILRRATGRQVAHGDPGSEWPQNEESDPSVLEAIASLPKTM